ncbi:AT-rich interactive domain-containing protein 6 isoform X2 [Macadamia integrifolia]|uniref:AT-rich interactive domain-containing protein 6 isoform X2 n=1 Tax=Macadamia integrifolia TaxID=60698 RepID=UPI001C4FB8F7|nr:AT-rich interactive domain-containing protein 6 isoform X2 [Macadamia integrifolia]
MSEMKESGEGGADIAAAVDTVPTGGEVEQERLPHSGENQNENPIENGHSPLEPSVDRNVELPMEDHSSDDEDSVDPASEPAADDANGPSESKSDVDETGPVNKAPPEDAEQREGFTVNNAEDENGEGSKNAVKGEEALPSEENGFKETMLKQVVVAEEYPVKKEEPIQSFLGESHSFEGDDSGTEEEQAAFMKELENFFRERSLEFKPPKFYGEGLNCLKLWRAVTRLGGYDKVTTCKLWRQVGESFKPPKTCTTVSWSFRCFYEKALLDYERHKMRGGELHGPVSPLAESMSIDSQAGGIQASGSGRARRDAAARAMQGWHSQRLLGNGEVGDPIIKDKNPVPMPKREKQIKSVGLHKRKKPSNLERAVKAARTKVVKPQMDTMVVDIGAPADWVKINVRKTKDCFEVYALVPGLLREEVRVQSDPAGRLVISGEPEQPDNPWGVTPFKKVVSLPSRIDPHQTSAVVTLHGQLFVRVPFEPTDL